jgi:hypothetical protein
MNVPVIILTVLLVMFPLGYCESLRWPLPPPKATHGILKGLLLFVLTSMVIFRVKLPIKIHPRGELLIMGVFLLSFVISSVFSLAPAASLLFLWYPCIATLYIYAFRVVRFQKKHVYVFIGISTVLIMITFMFSVFSIFSRYELDSLYNFLFLPERAKFYLDEIQKVGKYVSLGPYFMLMPFASLFLTESRTTITRKVISALVICVSALTAVISNNRIDVLVIAIQLGILIWFIPRRIAVTLLIAAIPITQLGLSITYKYFGFNLEERILRPQYERDTETILMRQTYLDTALYNFRQYPIFGTGPNSYNDVSDFPLRKYYVTGVRKYTARSDIGIGIHNIFIERLADTGLFGFFAFIAVLLYYMKVDVIRFFRKQNKEDRTRYALFALSSWSWILYGITDNGYGAQGFVTFFFLRGVLQHL